MTVNYYDLLGITKNSTEEEIKKAYRKKAMECHPDRHGWDKSKEAEFKKINEAYSVLSDSQKKAHYDRFGSTEWMWGSGFGQWWFNWWMDFDISDIFESFFGGWFGWQGSPKKKKDESGEDLEMSIRLDFSEAVFGGKKTIKYEKKVSCKTCSWTWAKPGTQTKTCGTCHGSWYTKNRTQSFFWVIEQTVACPMCHWTWTIIDTPCADCRWQKRVSEKTEKEIDIPAGIDDGMTIKLRWEGNEWTNGKSWDLFVTFRVPEEFEWLKRDWDNLHFELIIDPVEAILWAKRKEKLPLIGERTIEIKAWTQNEDILKFKWDWVKNVSRDSKWDLFLHITIRINSHLSKKERELYEEIAKEKWIDFADHKGFFGKMFG